MQIQPLNAFIDEFTHLIDCHQGDEDSILVQAEPILRQLLQTDNWLEPQYSRPHPEHYQQYLLHLDPQHRYSIVSFVWDPGQKTPVHDHTVWGLIGVLRGAEINERFEWDETGHALVSMGRETLRPGDIDKVSPTIGDMHRVANAYRDRPSISIHVYGGDIGRIRRHTYDPVSGKASGFVSGYSSV